MRVAPKIELTEDERLELTKQCGGHVFLDSRIS